MSSQFKKNVLIKIFGSTFSCVQTSWSSRLNHLSDNVLIPSVGVHAQKTKPKTKKKSAINTRRVQHTLVWLPNRARRVCVILVTTPEPPKTQRSKHRRFGMSRYYKKTLATYREKPTHKCWWLNVRFRSISSLYSPSQGKSRGCVPASSDKSTCLGLGTQCKMHPEDVDVMLMWFIVCTRKHIHLHTRPLHLDNTHEVFQRLVQQSWFTSNTHFWERM